MRMGFKRNYRGLLLAAGTALLAGCSDEEPVQLIDLADRTGVPEKILEVKADELTHRPLPNPDGNAYFGDLHVHTGYSFDAYVFGTTATPREAYRYAMGEGLMHPGGFEVKLKEPLDFYAVTDHAMFLGMLREAADTSTEASKLAFAEGLHNINAPDNMGLRSVGKRVIAFRAFITNAMTGLVDGSLDHDMVQDIARTAWADTVMAAEEYNTPGHFTTFVGYEYTTSTNEMGNLHRNVIFRSGEKVPAVPFSRLHSQNPEGLWDWMDTLRGQGIESLAIPHNSNGSNGAMFELTDWGKQPIDNSYAVQRMRNEPLVEITQVKGTSETHPALSDNDEWAGFEIMPFRVATDIPSEPKGSYVREALRNGLAFEEKGIVNPYKLGFAGASDTHTGAYSDDESNFFSKVGLVDSTAEMRASVPVGLATKLALKITAPDRLKKVEGKTYMNTQVDTFGAAGVTGVWAAENTREALYDAFRRKETFATSGPRIRVRFFAGYDFSSDLVDDLEMVSKAYATGVTMGGDLTSQGEDAPGFLLWTTRDPLGAPLQRAQIIKGWVDAAGKTQEKVYDVACSDGGTVDPSTNRCPDNGARVDVSDCSITADVGAGQLKSYWQDPDFVPGERAFYYARVLENPICRWSTWDAIKAGVEPRPDLQKTIQERAWSSPIWLNSAG